MNKIEQLEVDQNLIEDDLHKVEMRLSGLQGDFEGTLTGILSHELPPDLRKIIEEKLKEIKDRWLTESTH